MNGAREWFVCVKCGRSFTYWVAEGVGQPKVKCSFCTAEFFPRGEPPAAAPAPPPAKGPSGDAKGS